MVICYKKKSGNKLKTRGKKHSSIFEFQTKWRKVYFKIEAYERITISWSHFNYKVIFIDSNHSKFQIKYLNVFILNAIVIVYNLGLNHWSLNRKCGKTLILVSQPRRSSSTPTSVSSRTRPPTFDFLNFLNPLSVSQGLIVISQLLSLSID